MPFLLRFLRPKALGLPLTCRARAGAPRKAANACRWGAARSMLRFGALVGRHLGVTFIAAAKPLTPRPQAHEPARHAGGRGARKPNGPRAAHFAARSSARRLGPNFDGQGATSQPARRNEPNGWAH